MTEGAVYADISSCTGVAAADVEAVFDALGRIAKREVMQEGIFLIPRVAVLQLAHKAARPATKKMVKGKLVKFAGPTTMVKKVVKASPAPELKHSIFS